MKHLETLIYERLGDDRFGDGGMSPPGDDLYLRVGPIDRHPDGEVKPIYVVTTSNDGYELWIGTDDKWYWRCGQEDARRVAWFVLWTWWGQATWFGLRRRLWYWALGRRVERNRRGGR